MSPTEKCHRCGRPAARCHKYPVEGWPESARASMERAGWAYLHSCVLGIKRDLRGGLWCWDRVIRHPDYRRPVEPVETPEGEEVAA